MNLNECVLFSPVGKTDPVKNDRDGAMLHIIRRYKPCKVYLYFSEEIYELEKLDKRYTKVIEIFNPAIEIAPIIGKAEPHDFDGFVKEFNSIINDIYEDKDNEGKEILLNVTSGTPQMQLTLCAEAVTSNKNIKAIQVNSPEYDGNNKAPEAVDPYGLMNNNKDHIEVITKDQERAREVKVRSFRHSMLKTQIKALVEKYDYEGGAYLAQEYSNSNVKKLINHCQLRINLRHKEAMNEINDYKGHRLFPVSESRPAMLIEYLLTLKIKQKKGQLTDMVIGLNPFLIEVMSDYIEKILNVPVKRLQIVENKKTKVSRKKIEDFDMGLLLHLENSFKNRLQEEGYVSVDILYYMLEYYSTNERLRSDKLFYERLRNLNSKLRNSSAHNLIAISENDIHKESALKSREIIEKLEKQICRIYNNSIPDNCFEMYDKINGWIYKELDIYDDHSICI